MTDCNETEEMAGSRAEGAEKVLPYNGEAPKGEQVEEMFDSIAPHYDLMNTLMTAGLCRYWRDRGIDDALNLLTASGRKPDGIDILDVATGTGDLVFALHQRLPHAHICGVDLSEGMLAKARAKRATHSRESVPLMEFRKADCLNLPFDKQSFDFITVAYGVRNFQKIEEGYREMYRVLRPGGVLCVIELSQPENPTLRLLYNFYAGKVIPALGGMISGDRRAYTYLPESVAAAPQRGDMTDLMKRAGFSGARWRSLTFGVVTIYLAQKEPKN